MINKFAWATWILQISKSTSVLNSNAIRSRWSSQIHSSSSKTPFLILVRPLVCCCGFLVSPVTTVQLFTQNRGRLSLCSSRRASECTACLHPCLRSHSWCIFQNFMGSVLQEGAKQAHHWTRIKLHWTHKNINFVLFSSRKKCDCHWPSRKQW